MNTTTLPHFIGGRTVAAVADQPIPDVNPSDPRDVIGLVPEGRAQDVDEAVDAATTALAAWRRLPGPTRADHLYRWAAAIEARQGELATELAREVGKPIGEAKGEIGRCVVILRYYAGDAVRAIGEIVPAQAEGALQFTLREPLGVVGLITPWNFPSAIPLWKAAPAIAFGNTVVLKPSEMAPRCALLLAETAAHAGLPPGVFNVVLGTGKTVGEAMLAHEGIRGISFTGSAAVGARVAQKCAERNIRYQTEMGGKNVVIVLPDADLGLAAKLTAAGAMRYAGQKCTATSRAVVAREVADAFADALRREVDALPVGPVDEPTTAVGPLINESARDRVLAAVGAAGSKLAFGGSAPRDDRLVHGWFVEPAVVRDVEPDSPLAQDEIFGPVLATFTAGDLDEAIALANRTRFGLSASLFTRDLRAALTYIHRIEAGLVRVNGDTTGVDPHAPFGGVKGSSSGSREQGSAAREFYTEIKTVQVNG